jgi:hypothetical protein
MPCFETHHFGSRARRPKRPARAPVFFRVRRFEATMYASGFGSVWVPLGGWYDARTGVASFP